MSSLFSLRLLSLPFFRWLPELRQRGVLRADLLAGLTGAVVVLPQGVAFATLAGMPAQYGLYAAMLPCIVAALFGASRLMVTGPANAISLTTLALVAPLALPHAPGSAHYVQLVITLSFMVGLTQLLLGLARVGALADKVPHSVIVGFTAGAAVLIFNSQVGPALGLPLVRGKPIWDTLQDAFVMAGQVQWSAFVVALATVLFAIAAKPWNRWIPALLTAVVLGTFTAIAVAAWLPEWPALATVQALPGAWPPLSTPTFDMSTWRQLLVASLVMTLLALTEATAIAKAVALRLGDTLDSNQEFIGQGLANIAGSFFSAYPTSGSFNRSGVNLAAGARTPLSAIAAAVFLVLILLAVAPLARWLPLAVVAGLLYVVAWGLIDRDEIAQLWHEGWIQRVPLVLTFLATITLSLEWAIVLGLVSALVMRQLAKIGRQS